MPRLIRVITSFAVVLGAYWLYALLAVPLIEPAAAGPGGNRNAGRLGAKGRINNRLAELQQLIPPQARKLLEHPKIIESEDFKLLLQEYTNLGDGRVRIEPCMLIYTPGSSVEGAKPKPPVLLYAPTGAVMLFDRPLDLRRGDVGRPVSGKLLGEITITSPGESAGPEDDLQILTRDVQLTQERISTSNQVSFRYGASFGSGRNLLIKLLLDENRPGSASKAPDIKGIESFELGELDRLHLEPSKNDKPASVVAGQNGPTDFDSQRPLEITCQGPFRFEPVRQYAKFEDQVDVMQLNPEGEADQLRCELLTLYFSKSRKNLANLAGKTGPKTPMVRDANLQLREIEAKGNPVIVSAVSRDVEARGERLAYDVQKDQIVLEGSNDVFLRQGPNEFHARSIRYKSNGKGRLGEVFSKGPGRMSGQMSDRPGQEIFVSWADQLQLEPFKDQHLVTLSGGVELKYSGVGQLNAETIYFWLNELPAGPDREQLEVKPDRMLVQDRVKLNSPQVFGNVNEMQIWFKEVADTPPAEAVAASAPANRPDSGAGPPQGPLAMALEQPTETEPLERRFHVRGDVVQSRVLMRNRKAELAELMLEGSVQLDEIPLIRSSDQPMHLTGDRVQVREAHTPNAEISVIGRPAHFQGRGLALTGTNINVNAGTNRLWINGSGEMKLPMDRDLKGSALPRPEVLTVLWQHRMNFDGLTARFEEAVTAQAMNQHLRTDTLEVQFSQPIQFRNVRSESRPQPEVEQIVCRGKVFMEGRTFEDLAPGQTMQGAGFPNAALAPVGMSTGPPRQESWEQFEVVELTINRRTGELFAQGPGQMTTIRPQSAANLLQARQAPGGQPAASAPKENELAYLHVRFQDSITGNIETRSATFHDRVRCIYGKVESWQSRLDVNDPDALGIEGVLLTADRLTVAEAPAPVAGARTVELEAFGNVMAENSTYYARANRITYSQAKDWLILEGNGYAEAELWLQEYVGGPGKRIPARKILFWPSTKTVKIVDGQSVEMSALPMR